MSKLCVINAVLKSDVFINVLLTKMALPLRVFETAGIGIKIWVLRLSWRGRKIYGGDAQHNDNLSQILAAFIIGFMNHLKENFLIFNAGATYSAYQKAFEMFQP